MFQINDRAFLYVDAGAGNWGRKAQHESAVIIKPAVRNRLSSWCDWADCLQRRHDRFSRMQQVWHQEAGPQDGFCLRQEEAAILYFAGKMSDTSPGLQAAESTRHLDDIFTATWRWCRLTPCKWNISGHASPSHCVLCSSSATFLFTPTQWEVVFFSLFLSLFFLSASAFFWTQK